MANQPLRTASDHWNMPAVICPYCGKIQARNETLRGKLNKLHCDECGKPFECDADVIVHYTTRRMDDVECEPYPGVDGEGE